MIVETPGGFVKLGFKLNLQYLQPSLRGKARFCLIRTDQALGAIRKNVMKLILTCMMLMGPVSSAWATEANYRCADGTAVNAVFSAPGRAGSVQLTFSRSAKSVELPQVLSADGGRYADGDMEFWIKGNTARLTRPGAATDCTTR